MWALQVAAVCDHWRQPSQDTAAQSSASTGPGPQLPFWLLTKDADAQWQAAPLTAFQDVSTKQDICRAPVACELLTQCLCCLETVNLL